MYITEVSIKRPAVAWVLSLILIVFGIFVFWKLPVRELPSGLQPPVVQVKVEYKSASAPIIDEEVTQIIEDVIGGAEGIKNIDSISENGRATINIEFDTDIDLDAAANDIRERVARIVDNYLKKQVLLKYLNKQQDSQLQCGYLYLLLLGVI